MSGNSLIMLRPYKHEGSWVFDDDSVGLRREPFILGIDDMLDRMAESIPGAEAGFRLIVSARPFPGFAAKLEWQGEESGGNWYLWRAFGTRGWLCPALFKFFPRAPRHIYAKAEGREPVLPAR